MNKSPKKYIFLFTLLFFGCALFKKDPIKKILEEAKYDIDTTIYWRTDNYEELEFYLSYGIKEIEKVKQEFIIKDGRLFDLNSNSIVSNIYLHLRTGEIEGRYVSIIEGLPFGGYDAFRNDLLTINFNYFDNYGNIDGYYSSAAYNTTFKKGNGYCKDHYFDLYTVVKDEGMVKNNFKYGKWIYYNRNGEIDSIKTYTLKDSVDIRFPHCIFNKKDPCF